MSPNLGACCVSAEMKIEAFNHDDERIDLKTLGIHEIHVGPKNVIESIIQKIQWIELAEKIAELFDELFHLLQKILVTVASPEIYASLNIIHHGAHQAEQFLHCFCLIGDLMAIVKEGKKYLTEPNFIAVAAKIARLISHLLAPVFLLSDLKIIQLGGVASPLRALSAAFSASHYGLAVIAIIWSRFKEGKKIEIIEIATPLCGFVYHTFTVVQFTIPQAALYLELVKAVAGVAHAALAIYQLLPASHYHISH